MLNDIIKQRKQCQRIEDAFLAGKLNASSVEMAAVRRMRRFDRPLTSRCLGVLDALVARSTQRLEDHPQRTAK